MDGAPTGGAGRRVRGDVRHRRADLSARDRPGVSAFVLEDGVVYHTYSTYARGLDGVWGMYQWLDRAPTGRNETGVWWRRHDEYGPAREAGVPSTLREAAGQCRSGGPAPPSAQPTGCARGRADLRDHGAAHRHVLDGGTPDGSLGGRARRVTGRAEWSLMYLLMSAFHAAPRLRLVAGWRSRWPILVHERNRPKAWPSPRRHGSARIQHDDPLQERR